MPPFQLNIPRICFNFSHFVFNGTTMISEVNTHDDSLWSEFTFQWMFSRTSRNTT